jgi:acyl carrier protein
VIGREDELESDVRDLVARVLRLPEPYPDRLMRSALPQWDSLKHMEIVFALEDRYGVCFDESEFATLRAPAEIAAALRRHRAP